MNTPTQPIETALMHNKDLKQIKKREHTSLVLYYFSGAFLKKIIIGKYHTKFIHTLARDSQLAKVCFLTLALFSRPTFESPDRSFFNPPISPILRFRLLKLLPFCPWLNCNLLQQDVQTSDLSAFMVDLMQVLSASFNDWWQIGSSSD